MMKQAALAAVLAVLTLGCSHDGASPEPSPELSPECIGLVGSPDAVNVGDTWVWCDGATSGGLCAEDWPDGQVLEICGGDPGEPDDLCLMFTGDGWGWTVEHLGTDYPAGSCLTDFTEDGLSLWIR